MRKIVTLLGILILFFSCKEEVVEKPNHLIAKDLMQDILYDLSLLEAMKFGSPASLHEYKINPKEYIYKKYKIDSAQFSQSNIYYAANYNEYREIIDEVLKRIDSEKIVVDSLVKIEKKRDSLDRIKKGKRDSKFIKDSLALVNGKVQAKRDSLMRLRNKGLLKTMPTIR